MRPARSKALSSLLLFLTLGTFAAGFATALPQGSKEALPPGTQPSRNARSIPPHPRDLKYAPLVFAPPKAGQYRHVLSSGTVAYLVEDHDLPLINLSVLIRAGKFMEPSGKEGLAALTGSQIRAGGTTSKTADEFNEAADFLAAQIFSGIGETQGTASLNCLTKKFDEALALFFDVLRNPRFQPDRLDLARSQTLQQMERRNDATEEIEAREWARLIRGPEHFTNRLPTKASVESITREDLLSFHKRYFHPGTFVFAASGDFKTSEMLARLESSVRGWEVNKTSLPEVPKPAFMPVPGVYAVHRPDVNQGRVLIGHLGAMRDIPDSYALSIMNDILGGPDFSSRLLGRVRSDEGLAYDAGSEFGLGVYYPGDFRARFQSKSATCAQAISIVLEEINRIRSTQVSEDELTTSKNQAIEVFPRFFAAATQVAGTFAQDEFTRRPAGYWDRYRDKIKAVTADDLQRAAQRYLQPDNLVILIVGNIEEIAKGNPDKPQYSISKFPKDGKIHRIPLPDPMTMTYPKAE